MHLCVRFGSQETPIRKGRSRETTTSVSAGAAVKVDPRIVIVEQFFRGNPLKNVYMKNEIFDLEKKYWDDMAAQRMTTKP